MSFKLILKISVPMVTTLLMTGCLDDIRSTTEAPAEAVINNAQAADVVIGQSNFNDQLNNRGGTIPGANTASYPYGNPGVLNGRLYLPDFFNNRLLGFNTIPTVNNVTADFTLGQVDFTSITTGVSSSELNGPMSVFFDVGGRMFLTDFYNSRILIWNTAPTTGPVAADVIVGSPTGLTACSAGALSLPQSAWATPTGQLIVADTFNNRVLIWNSIPTSNVPANIVLGQQIFDSCVENGSHHDSNHDKLPSATTLNMPTGVWSDGTRLVVLDSGNHRVLIWNTFPSSNATPANIVLGQSDFDRNGINDDDQDGKKDADATARTLNTPDIGVYSDGIRLFITDTGNNRVLIWDNFPTTNFTPADRVLGQGGLTHWAANDDNLDGIKEENPSARTLSNPTGVFHVGNQLFVTDTMNNRYLIYDFQ